MQKTAYELRISDWSSDVCSSDLSVGGWSGGAATAGDGSVGAVMSAPYTIRVVGDPVLRAAAAEVTDIDGKVVKLAHDMLETMYEAPGLGLAAPQIGVGKRLFVYDLDPEERAAPQDRKSTRLNSSH